MPVRYICSRCNSVLAIFPVTINRMMRMRIFTGLIPLTLHELKGAGKVREILGGKCPFCGKRLSERPEMVLG